MIYLCMLTLPPCIRFCLLSCFGKRNKLSLIMSNT
uniref:Uncharacterized protein n=1 Tax=Arundo donax TaxID=35708 RepID=A0A0A9ANY8_ARUDO